MTALSLDALRDIHVPPEPALAVVLSPWGVAVMASLGLVLFLWYFARWRRRRPYRVAIGTLTQLTHSHEKNGDGTALARGLSQLLRGYAAIRWGGAKTQALTGQDWLDFLDAHGGKGRFANGVGAVLVTLPYRPHGDFDAAALIALVRAWLRENAP